MALKNTSGENSSSKRKNTQKIITNNVFLISPFEHLFSAIGIFIEEQKGSSSNNAKAFARLGDVDVKVGNLGTEARPHMSVPKKTTVDGINLSESDFKIKNFFEEQNNLKEIRLVDNSFGIISENNKVPFNPNSETQKEKTITKSGKSSSKDVYKMGTTPNMFPWHFLQGAGYRALYYFLNKKRFVYRHQGQEVSKTIDEFSRTYKKVFCDIQKITQIILNSDFLLKIYDENVNFRSPTKYQYLYATILNGAGAESEKIVGRENVKTISHICDYTTSLSNHPYVPTLHKAILDTYNAFTMTHSSGNTPKNYEVALFAVLANPSSITRAIIENLKFPSDKRYISLDMDTNRIIEDEAISYTMSRRESSSTSIDGNPESFKKTLGRSIPVMVGILDVDIKTSLYNVGSNYKNSVEERKRFLTMLDGYAGFPGFCIVKKSGLFSAKGDSTGHAMACDGIFKGSNNVELLALPFFFLKYIVSKGYCNQIVIDKMIVFTHRDNVSISDLSNGVIYGYSAPFMATTFYFSNFFVTPFLSLCEKMAKVMNSDVIYQDIITNMGSSPLKGQIEMVMNNNSGEGIIFSSKDTDTTPDEVKQKLIAIDIKLSKENKYSYDEYFKLIPLSDPKRKNEPLHFYPRAESELKTSIPEALASEKVNLLTDALDFALTDWYNKHKEEIEDEEGKVKSKGAKQ